MDRLRERWEALRWRFVVLRFELQARALAISTLLALGAFLAALIAAPDWTLRFSRALAWPVVALIALLVFRLPFAGLLQGQALRRLAFGPASAELQAREEPFAPAAVAPNEDRAALERALVNLGTLAQAYESQIDFLRILRQAESGLTADAAYAFFRGKLGTMPEADGAAVAPLLQWLVARHLIMLLEDGRYILTDAGSHFLDDIAGFWYAPKQF